MSEQCKCNKCGYVFDTSDMMCSECGDGFLEPLRWTKGGDGSHWEGCENVHWDCKIAQLEARIAELKQELNTTDGLLKEATETIGAVVACCTYNSNEDAKIGIYGIDQKAFTMIDQFITHYNDAVSAGKVSVAVKRELTDAEIEELGAQEAERKEFCPNCEAEVPCTHEAELYVCDICGEDFAKYILSRNCNVSDVSMTRDVSIDIKTPSSIENTNPDYYKQEIARRDEELALTEKKLCNIDRSARAEVARRDEIITRLKEVLPTLKISHNYCEDCWYSCPKHEDGCCNEAEGEDCNCGADEHNSKIDALMKELE